MEVAVNCSLFPHVSSSAQVAKLCATNGVAFAVLC